MVLLGSFPWELAGWWYVKDVVGVILLMSKCATTLPVTGSSGLCLLNYLVGEWENKREIQSKLFLLWNYDNFGFQPNEVPWKFTAFNPCSPLASPTAPAVQKNADNHSFPRCWRLTYMQNSQGDACQISGVHIRTLLISHSKIIVMHIWRDFSRANS